MKALRPWLLPAFSFLAGMIGVATIVTGHETSLYTAVVIGVNLGFAFAQSANIVLRRMETKVTAYRLLVAELDRIRNETIPAAEPRDPFDAPDPFRHVTKESE